MVIVIGIMEKKTESTLRDLGFRVPGYSKRLHPTSS